MHPFVTFFLIFFHTEAGIELISHHILILFPLSSFTFFFFFSFYNFICCSLAGTVDGSKRHIIFLFHLFIFALFISWMLYETVTWGHLSLSSDERRRREDRAACLFCRHTGGPSEDEEGEKRHKELDGRPREAIRVDDERHDCYVWLLFDY